MNFILEPWNESYIMDVAKYGNNKKIADNLRDGYPNPYTAEDAAGYIKACIEKEGKDQMTRAIVVNGEAIGSIGIFMQDNVYRKSGELGYWLGEPFWGNGIMSKAVKQICQQVFEQYDIIRISAEPYAYNKGSRLVLEKAGFTLEGVLRDSICKNDKIFDSCIYALLKER